MDFTAYQLRHTHLEDSFILIQKKPLAYKQFISFHLFYFIFISFIYFTQKNPSLQTVFQVGLQLESSQRDSFQGS